MKQHPIVPIHHPPWGAEEDEAAPELVWVDRRVPWAVVDCDDSVIKLYNTYYNDDDLPSVDCQSIE